MPDSTRFTETMTGWLGPLADTSAENTHEAAASRGRTQGTDALFTLTVLTADADGMVADPRHPNPAFGVVWIPSLHPEPMGVSAGVLELFVDISPGIVHMRYVLPLLAGDGTRYCLRGIKEVVRRRPWPTVLTDTTTLFVDIYAGEHARGRPVRRGILTMGPSEVTMQGLSFRGGGRWWGLRGIITFMRYYVRTVAAIYLGGRSQPRRAEWSRIDGDPSA